jgi:hypothetical protein
MSESTRMCTAKAYLNALDTLDLRAFNAVLEETFTQTICPASIAPPSGPLDKHAFISRMSSLRPVMDGFPFTILDIIESESSNSVWAHGTAVPEWKSEAKGEGDWHFKGEYVFMLWMDESGEKVVRCVEMVDSQGTERMGRLFVKAKENVEAFSPTDSGK